MALLKIFIIINDTKISLLWGQNCASQNKMCLMPAALQNAEKDPLVMILTGSQKNPVLVIETGTFHHNVIRRNSDLLVTGRCQLPCVFRMLGLRSIVTGWLKRMRSYSYYSSVTFIPHPIPTTCW